VDDALQLSKNIRCFSNMRRLPSSALKRRRIGESSAGGSLIRNDNPEQDRANEVKPMHYVYPLDPECPVVAEFMETLFGDPTTMAMGALASTF
jgi:hypothetical protein